MSSAERNNEETRNGGSEEGSVQSRYKVSADSDSEEEEHTNSQSAESSNGAMYQSIVQVTKFASLLMPNSISPTSS
jgi:hypothetical protein